MRIELRGVRKRFGKTDVLRGIDVTVESGRRVALIGPNGSGKSTLLRAVLGLLDCEGEVLLDGRSPSQERIRLARRVAYVPQIAPQLSASVGEVVRLVALTRDIPVGRIAELGARLELDVERIRVRPFRKLSGGMKQKLLIAIAFASGAELLVLDEPTASLDAAARERFFELFGELSTNATLLLCSHRIEELRHLADHVLALNEGRVTHDCPVTSFLGERGASVLEVQVDSSEGAEWLADRAFRSGAPGWWVRTLSQADKVPLVRELTQKLDGTLRNLLIRDLVKVDASTEGSEHVA